MKNWLKQNLEKGFLQILGIVFTLSGVGVILYQIYSWLRFGKWLKISLIDAGQYFYWEDYISYSGGIAEWLYYPTDWVGIHTAFNHIPISIILILFGIIFFASAYELD